MSNLYLLQNSIDPFYGACLALAFGIFFFVIGGWSIGVVTPRFIDAANIAQIKGLLCFIVAATLWDK